MENSTFTFAGIFCNNFYYMNMSVITRVFPRGIVLFFACSLFVSTFVHIIKRTLHGGLKIWYYFLVLKTIFTHMSHVRLFLVISHVKLSLLNFGGLFYDLVVENIFLYIPYIVSIYIMSALEINRVSVPRTRACIFLYIFRILYNATNSVLTCTIYRVLKKKFSLRRYLLFLIARKICENIQYSLVV